MKSLVETKRSCRGSGGFVLLSGPGGPEAAHLGWPVCEQVRCNENQVSLKMDHSGRKPPPGLHFKPLNLTYYGQPHGAADHLKQNYSSLSLPPSAKAHPGWPGVVKLREASKWVVPSHLRWRLIAKSGRFLSSTFCP